MKFDFRTNPYKEGNNYKSLDYQTQYRNDYLKMSRKQTEQMKTSVMSFKAKQ